MKKYTLIFAGILFTGTLFGQFSGNREEIPPDFTEVWEPVPEVIIPGQGTAPPSDAIVLFDGTNLDGWEKPDGGPADWDLSDGAMTVIPKIGGIQTKQSFGDVQLHVEWRTPSEVVGKSQGRGNSGIFIQTVYEVQVLDNYDNITYPNGQAGSIYKQYIPEVNACLPPGEWQTYDIIFIAPRFKKDSTLFTPATITVLHNGVLVLNHVSIKGATEFRGIPVYNYHEPKRPIFLQEHGNPVSYRNIWVREL